MKAEQSIFRSTFWYSLPSFIKPVLIIYLDWQIAQNQFDKKTSQLLERSFLFHQTCLKVPKNVSKGTPLRYPWGLCPRSNRRAVTRPPSITGVFYKRGRLCRFAATPGDTSPPRRYQRGYFLFDTLLVPFLVKEKEPRAWGAQPHIMSLHLALHFSTKKF